MEENSRERWRRLGTEETEKGIQGCGAAKR